MYVNIEEINLIRSCSFRSGFSKFSSVQSLSCIWLFATPWTAAHQVSLSIINFRSPLRLMSIDWWCHPTISSSVVLFSSCLQSFPASGSFQRSQPFTSGGQSIGGQLQRQSSNEYSGLISFRMDWLYLLVVQGTLKSLLQHHSSKASILWCSACFIVQLSHPYMTTGQTIALLDSANFLAESQVVNLHLWTSYDLLSHILLFLLFFLFFYTTLKMWKPFLTQGAEQL